MATTSIWPVKGYLGKVVVYVENPDKTANPKMFIKPDMTEDERQELSDVIEYAAENEKTAMKHFVSGVNCLPETARDEMLMTKRLYEKEGGRVAFHGYQSFADGEVTPETAHEIGVKLAQEVWGDDFQVLVATHVDNMHQIHSHFVVNSVAVSDGHRFHNSRKDYLAMRSASDRLCREYSLSVIENPKPGKSKKYAEWSAEKDGKLTWRGIIKADIDEAIRESMTDTQFFQNLKQRGYDVKTGKDISVRPPGKDRFFRLARNLGDGYSPASIRARLLMQSSPRYLQHKKYGRRRQYGILDKSKRRKIGGLLGLYLHYQYLLGNLPRRGSPPRRSHFSLKEDLAKLSRISAETKLLLTNRIETADQLAAFASGRKADIQKLSAERDVLRRRLKHKKPAGSTQSIKEEISEITEKLKHLRKDVRLAEDIAQRSKILREKISVISKSDNQKKEKANDDLFR